MTDPVQTDLPEAVDPNQPLPVPGPDAVSADVPQVVDNAPVLDDIDAAMDDAIDDSVTTDETPVAVEPEEPKRQAHRAFQEFSIHATEPVAGGDELILPPQFDKETRQVLDNIPNINLLDSPQARDWARAVEEGLSYTTYDETFCPTLEDQSADFRQRVVHNNIGLAGAAPKMKAVENENLKGERAIIRMISHLGLGTLFQVPLWHSGFWITFKPPTDSELVELNRLMLADKVRFGRNTYGLAFSNTTSYTNDRLVSFALAHVYDVTTKSDDINIENLRDHISSQDLPSLLWGFACTMYPRGFNYRRPCVADPENCKHVLEETLNLFKLQWTNTNALTDWQRTHMSVRQSKSKDLTSVTRYKEELTRIQKKRITINEGKSNSISFTIKTPSVREYIDAGHRWIAGIVSTVDRALGTADDENERNAMVVKHGQATSMRQYAHWIDNIEYETNTITELETIEDLLGTLSSDDEIRVGFIKAVVDFINSSTISLIGIPVFDCPNCGKTNEGEFNIPGYKNVIPLDMVQVFFGLLTQRLERIAER